MQWENPSLSSENLIGRGSRPMNLRLLLQPVVAAFFGARAGLRDAREGRRPYGWTLVSTPAHRTDLLREAWGHVGKVFFIATILYGI
jgi:hypothetical protein